MAESLGKAVLELDADTGPIDQKLDKTEKDVEGLGTRLKDGAKGHLKAIGAAAGAAAVGGVAILAKSAIDMASDINESLTKNQTLFGKYSKDIEEFAETSGEKFGISKKAALEYTGVFGNLSRAIGISRKDSAKMSTDLTKLAADMASFNNTSIEDALEALRSGLVGETEPLRKFGVTLSANSVAAQAMRMGLVKVKKETLEYREANLAVEKAEAAKLEAIKKYGKDSIQAREATIDLEKANKNLTKVAAGGKVELTAQQKAIATQALIMRQTSAAHGDFEKTSEGAANQQRILQARMEDMQAKLGAKLLPMWVAVVSVLVDLVSIDFGGLIRSITGLFSSGESGGGKMSGAIKTLTSIISGLKTIGVEAINFLRGAWDLFGSDIIAQLKNVGDFLWSSIQNWLKVIQGIVDFVAGVFTGDWGRAWDGIKAIFSGLVGQILNIIGFLFSSLGNAFSIGWTAIKWLVSTAIDGIIGLVKGIPGRLASFVGGIFDGIKDAAEHAVNAAIGFVKGIPDKLVTAFKKGGELIVKLAGVGTDIGDAIMDALKAVISGSTDVAKSVANAIIGFINKMIDKLNNALEFKIKGPGPLPDFEINAPDIPHVPKFHSGTPYFVPPAGAREGFALLKRGEAVLPEGLLDNVGGAGGGGPLVNIEKMQVRDTFDIRAVADRVAWELQ